MAVVHENRLPTAIPLPLSQDVLEEIVSKAKDWALMHGAAMRSRSHFSTDGMDFAPFILTPSAFPRTEFERAQRIQPLLNTLMHQVAHNRDFLTACLRETIKVDAFTSSLFDVYNKVYAEGMTQPVSLGLLRADLMLETNCSRASGCDLQRPYCCWKQVECNTIAAGFGWLGPASRLIQSFVLESLGHADKVKNMPENTALTGICSGMLEAHSLYGSPDAVILFVVEDVTFNICDQRFHEFEVQRLSSCNVKVKRRTLTQIADNGRLGPNKELLIDHFEVAVVYFRAGYEPNHYPSQREWDARLLVERSLAIKCPSIHYHLAGTKKVQQELAKPGVLEMFLRDKNEISNMRAIFTGLYSLDFDDAGDAGVQLAIDDPERYVLKPQREGGGNNVYGVKIRETMTKMKSSSERSAWILMERIHPPISRSYMIRPGGSDVPEMVDLVSELGIFGYILGDATKIISNKQVGHMLRSKIATADEGGVAAGLGALDSPYLID